MVPELLLPSTPPEPPLARESVPAINIRNVSSPWRDNRTRGEWRNEQGGLVAVAEMMSLERDRFEFAIEWIEGAQLKNMRTSLEVIQRPGRVGKGVQDTRCPRCQAQITTLYFFERLWCCAACHDLVGLTTTLTPEQELNRRYWAKYRKVLEADPFSRSTKTLEKDERAAARLREQLRERGIEPHHRDLPAMVQLRWLHSDDALGDPDEPEKSERLQPLARLERPKLIPSIVPWFGPWNGHV